MAEARKLPSLDYWRALAILLVVCWHFFPFSIELGRIGVEIFFVLSGFLVSRPLIQAALSHSRIPWKRFSLSRFFRIIPAYYLYLALATAICFFALPHLGDGVLIPLEAWPSYLLLYKNYNTYAPGAFGHIWTLCVEEHFYILLPIFFVCVRKLSVRSIVAVILIILLFEIFVRYVGYTQYFESNYSFFFGDPAATHNNLDGLLYGVLLRFAYECGLKIKRGLKIPLFVIGLVGISISNYYASVAQNGLFHLTLMKSVDAICIVAMIWATISFESKSLAGLRKIASVSYNWYLWHLVILLVVEDYLGRTWFGFLVYVIASYLVALIITRFIERVVDRRTKKFIPAN